MTLLRSLCLGFAVTNALGAINPSNQTTVLLQAIVAGCCVTAVAYRFK